MNIRLTQYSHGAGCGCKLSPSVLDEVLHIPEGMEIFRQKGLLVGNEGRDDAAAVELPDGNVLLSTTDFFMPIVDDPYDFGRVAATNAISDIYAMGGKPILAIAILGWPIEKLPASIASKVLTGARSIAAEAGMQIAGGHSIDSPEPIFGLAVNGIVSKANLKTNSGAKPGDILFLTKPLGIGILTTAEKKVILKEKDRILGLSSMTTLNALGEKFGTIPEIHAMTDVTGFGLGGHLLELCRSSQLSAEIHWKNIPFLCDLETYLVQSSIPGGTKRNLESYGNFIREQNIDSNATRLTPHWKTILADPQTSGGLLLSVSPSYANTIQEILEQSPFPNTARPIGRILKPSENLPKDSYIFCTPS